MRTFKNEEETVELHDSNLLASEFSSEEEAEMVALEM